MRRDAVFRIHTWLWYTSMAASGDATRDVHSLFYFACKRVCIVWPFHHPQVESSIIYIYILTYTEFATAPVDVPAIIGERVYLYCDYPGSISETWSTDNGITIQSSPSNGYQCNCFPQTNGTGSVLYFPQVGSGDYRNYTCSVQIGFGINCHVTAAIRAAGERAATLYHTVR